MKLNLPKFAGTAGAAFLLRTPSKKSIELQHPEGVVTVRAGAAYVTVALNNPQDISSVRPATWKVIQEAFDCYAATHRVALSTEHGSREYFLWIRTKAGYHLICVNTFDTLITMEARVDIHAPTSTLAVVPIISHPSLRYYRISQLSDDLFDAYRNAYLCLECLVSDESPMCKKGKDRESEIAWLKRVLGGPLSAPLQDLDVNEFVNEIYDVGRNPLFHAKSNETSYSPHGEEREIIQSLLERLTFVLIRLLKYKFGNSIGGLGASFSTDVEDGQARVFFMFDELIFKQREKHVSTIPTIEVVDSPRRFGQIWGKVTVSILPDLAYFDGIEALRDGKTWFGNDFEEGIPLEQVCSITFEFSNLMYSGRAANPLHAV
jgi:hypothetical protein